MEDLRPCLHLGAFRRKREIKVSVEGPRQSQGLYNDISLNLFIHRIIQGGLGISGCTVVGEVDGDVEGTQVHESTPCLQIP